MAIDWDALVLAPVISIFGEPVQYLGQPFSETSGAINGVFDEAYLEVEPLGRGGLDMGSMEYGAPGGVSTEMPVLGVRLADFATAPQQGDRLIVRGERYAVKEVRPDGHGSAKLLLNAACD